MGDFTRLLQEGGQKDEDGYIKLNTIQKLASVIHISSSCAKIESYQQLAFTKVSLASDVFLWRPTESYRSGGFPLSVAAHHLREIVAVSLWQSNSKMALISSTRRSHDAQGLGNVYSWIQIIQIHAASSLVQTNNSTINL